MPHAAYDNGWNYARYHQNRPCLGTLTRGWHYNPYEALQFALGFFDRKRGDGDEAHVVCGCGPKPMPACNWLIPD